MVAPDWERVRREFAIVERMVPVLGGQEVPLVYLDHAASTHAPHSVMLAYMDFLENDYSNIHRGTHLLSRRATVRFEGVDALVEQMARDVAQCRQILAGAIVPE